MSSPYDGPPGEAPPRYSDDEVDYLLSAGGLGGSQRGRIFDAVVGAGRIGGDRTTSRSRTARWIGALGAAVAAATVLVLGWTWRSDNRASFQRKGDLAVAAPAIDVECLRATLTACPRGSVLVFSASGASLGMFVTAYLQSPTSGPNVWLLSNEPATARAPGDSGLLAKGARIPDNLAAGSYTVEVLLTRRPLARAEAASIGSSDLVTRARFKVTVPR